MPCRWIGSIAGFSRLQRARGVEAVLVTECGAVRLERGPGHLPNTRNDYYVAPRTYTPLGLVIQMTGGTFVRERDTTYELLPGGPRTLRRLVMLTGAHPHARVNTSTTAWNTASKYLLP